MTACMEDINIIRPLVADALAIQGRVDTELAELDNGTNEILTGELNSLNAQISQNKASAKDEPEEPTYQDCGSRPARTRGTTANPLSPEEQ